METVTTAVPVPPGAMLGVDVATLRSDERARLVTAGADELFPGVGSEVADVTESVPPEIVELGVAFAASFSGTSTVTGVPGAIGPVMVQDSGPFGSVPVHPVGSAVIWTPAGGV